MFRYPLESGYRICQFLNIVYNCYRPEAADMCFIIACEYRVEQLDDPGLLKVFQVDFHRIVEICGPLLERG